MRVFVIMTVALMMGAGGASAAECGGKQGKMCGKTEWCSFPTESRCGVADVLGTCKPRPVGECSTVNVVEVCACNGKDYPSACEAQKAGYDVLHDGKCAAKSE